MFFFFHFLYHVRTFGQKNCFVHKDWVTNRTVRSSIGGSKGGHQGHVPSRGPNSFNSMQFWGVIGQIMAFHIHLWSLPLPPGKSWISHCQGQRRGVMSHIGVFIVDRLHETQRDGRSKTLSSQGFAVFVFFNICEKCGEVQDKARVEVCLWDGEVGIGGTSKQHILTMSIGYRQRKLSS